MLTQELRTRAKRIVDGTAATIDIDRIYLALRSHRKASSPFREIADFIAHRDERDKGITTDVGRDVFTSVSVWSLGLRDKTPTWNDLVHAAQANLRLASDEQIKNGCGCNRQTATTRLSKALKKRESGIVLKKSEAEALEYFGNRFIWKPALRAACLLADFRETLIDADLIDASETFRPEVQPLLALHAVAVMHGSKIRVADDICADLFAGYANKDKHLEVKVEFEFRDWVKPITIPICMFLTELSAADVCEGELISERDVMFNSWSFSIEVGSHGKLQRMIS